jgi:hypothetical protein
MELPLPSGWLWFAHAWARSEFELNLTFIIFGVWLEIKVWFPLAIEGHTHGGGNVLG